MSAAVEIKYVGMKASQKEWDDIWEMLCLCDREFVPSLSSRNSTAQTNLLDASDTILKHLYDYMEYELPYPVRCKRITTRTWSGNDAQIHTLKKRGYVLFKSLANDRGAGIDTLYFVKKLDR